MANVTRGQYVAWINAVGNVAINRTTKVSGTDISRAAAQGITISSANTSNPGNINASDLGNVLQGSPILGSPPEAARRVVVAEEIRTEIITRAINWSRVRRVRYRLLGNVAPAGSTYTRYGYITSPAPTSDVPSSPADPLYADLFAGEDIDETQFLAITSALTGIVDADSNILEHSDITYCHSNCHSSCHASRGRR